MYHLVFVVSRFSSNKHVDTAITMMHICGSLYTLSQQYFASLFRRIVYFVGQMSDFGRDNIDDGIICLVEQGLPNPATGLRIISVTV